MLRLFSFFLSDEPSYRPDDDEGPGTPIINAFQEIEIDSNTDPDIFFAGEANICSYIQFEWCDG